MHEHEKRGGEIIVIIIILPEMLEKASALLGTLAIATALALQTAHSLFSPLGAHLHEGDRRERIKDSSQDEEFQRARTSPPSQPGVGIKE